MLDVTQFLNQFVSHFQTCKSSEFILKKSASFESWFRAEIPVVLEKWYAISNIDTNFRYPNNNTKADLVIKTNDEIIVFELKSFVSHQDANKKENYPIQIKSLETIVDNNSCKQGITFTTFTGYSQKQIDSMLIKFFTNNKWKSISIPIPNSTFAFHVGSYTV